MSSPREQLEAARSPVKDGPARRKYAKRQLAKAERREAKLLEDAPKKRRFEGYTG